MSENEVRKFIIEVPQDGFEPVLRWFKSLTVSGRLSHEIIKLVESHLRDQDSFGYCQIPTITAPVVNHSRETAENNDILNSIYNWQDAQSELYKDETRKEKKRMLSV